MEFLVLGPVELRANGNVEVLSGRLQRVLLGVLLARANHPVSVDTLTDALWGAEPDPRSGQKLQLHIHRLRGLLDNPERLSLGSAGYRLRVDDDEIDAGRFETLVGEATAVVAQEPQRAVKVARSALALWRDTPFRDVDVSPLAEWRRRLTERRLVATETLHQAELACGLHTAIIGQLTELVEQHPLRERLHGLLMTALYRAGRREEALEAYGRAERLLGTRLGLEPGPELRELARRIDTGEEVAPGGLGGSRDAGSGAPAQLPVDVRGFVGRESELDRLDGLLSVTTTVAVVTGTAGVGKTALVVRWAHRVRDRFPDGQLYVDLRGYGPDQLVSPGDALAGFLRALGLDGAAIPRDLAERAARFRALVEQRRMLIVLDNARTVDQVLPLLPAGPSCLAVVTSREALTGLIASDGAHRVSLGRLVPREARQLLRDLIGDRVEVEPEAVDVLTERCARLPLALRVTAELIRSRPGRTVDELVAELAAELADQQGALDLLDVDDDPHTTVRAVFSWSYHQLDPSVARLFRLVGLHPGQDIDAYAVAALVGVVVPDARRALGVLVRAHLVDESADGRYQPHDLLRAYAAELAQATDSAEDRRTALSRLLGYYLVTASAAMDVVAPHEADRRPKITEPDRESPAFAGYSDAFGWLDAERANLLVVAQQGDQEFVIRMSDTIWRYLNIGGYHDEAVALHTRALEAALARGDTAAEADARRVLGAVLLRIGDNDDALRHLELALAAYRHTGNRSLQAGALNNLGSLYRSMGSLRTARDYYRQALALHGQVRDERVHSAPLNNLAHVLRSLGEYEEAFEYFQRGLTSAVDAGNRTSEGMALVGLADVCVDTGEHGDAFEYARRGLAVAGEIGNRTVEADALRALGTAHLLAGEPEQALRQHESALTICRALGDIQLLTSALNGAAAAHSAVGDLTEAARLYQEVVDTATEILRFEEHAHAHASLGAMRATVGDAELAEWHWRRAHEIYELRGVPPAARKPTGPDAAMRR